MLHYFFILAFQRHKQNSAAFFIATIKVYTGKSHKDLRQGSQGCLWNYFCHFGLGSISMWPMFKQKFPPY